MRGLATPIADGGPSAPGGPWELPAFRLVYEEHGQAVHALAGRVAWPEVAEDVTQEVFVRLWRHPDRYDVERGPLRAYLLTMTRSVAIDTIRSDTARRAREGRHGAERSAVAAGDEVDDRITRAGRLSDIAHALATLGPDERAAVVTAFYGECTYRQAALALDVPEGTVKSRIRRGLQRLKVELDDSPGAPDALPAGDRWPASVDGPR